MNYDMKPIVGVMDNAITKLNKIYKTELCTHPFKARRFADGGRVNFCIACGFDFNEFQNDI